MAPYRAEYVRDETLEMLDRLQRERESKLAREISDMQRQTSLKTQKDATNSELKHMWGLEAKVEAQFAYMRRLVRTQGFVMRSMSDFDGLDIDGSDRLEPSELQEFIKKRDGFATKFTIIEARTRELLSDLDVDGDGKVSRMEWLLYMTYLHWQAFIEENVVEKVVEVTKEYKKDSKTGTPVLVENIVQHPPVMRSNSRQGQNGSPTKYGSLKTQSQGMLEKNGDAGGSIVERVQQNPDGSLVTTIEHTELQTIKKKAATTSTGWCGVCL